MPTCARTTGGGGLLHATPHPRGEREGSLPSSSRGQAVSGGTGMGPRIREEREGSVAVFVFAGAG